MVLAKSPLTGASERRERGRQEMRSAILDAAGRIVAAEGVDGLTIRAVAQAVGYSAGALYEYFDSKEAILAALYFEGADGLGSYCERAVDALPEGATAIEALAALGQAYRSYALAHPELYRLVFGSFKKPPAPLETRCEVEGHGGFDLLMRIAEQGVAEGSMAGLPLPVIASAAWSIVHGFVSLELTGHLTGGDRPGEPPASPEEGRRRRDDLFAALLDTTVFGLVNEDRRAPLTGA